LFDLCAGFVYSQVLVACVRLRLFELLAQGPRTVHELSAAMHLPEDATLTLLHAAAALSLVQWREQGTVCGLGRHGAALLGNPGLLPMIAHHALFYRDLQDPVALLRQPRAATGLGGFWAYARAARPADLHAAQVAGYTALM
jgi:demethylspheroidene O-methyltransferase